MAEAEKSLPEFEPQPSAPSFHTALAGPSFATTTAGCSAPGMVWAGGVSTASPAAR